MYTEIIVDHPIVTIVNVLFRSLMYNYKYKYDCNIRPNLLIFIGNIFSYFF